MVSRRGTMSPDGLAHSAIYDVESSDPRSVLIDRSGVGPEDLQQIAALMGALMGKAGHAVAKERLSELVFAGETSSGDVQADAIEVVVYRLRKKLESGGVKIATVRGLGYCLERPQGE